MGVGGVVDLREVRRNKGMESRDDEGRRCEGS